MFKFKWDANVTQLKPHWQLTDCLQCLQPTDLLYGISIVALVLCYWISKMFSIISIKHAEYQLVFDFISFTKFISKTIQSIKAGDMKK